jgi:hypothetical protein
VSKERESETYVGIHHRLDGTITARMNDFLVVSHKKIGANDECRHGKQRLVRYVDSGNAYEIVLQRER